MSTGAAVFLRPVSTRGSTRCADSPARRRGKSAAPRYSLSLWCGDPQPHTVSPRSAALFVLSRVASLAVEFGTPSRPASAGVCPQPRGLNLRPIGFESRHDAFTGARIPRIVRRFCPSQPHPSACVCRMGVKSSWSLTTLLSRGINCQGNRTRISRAHVRFRDGLRPPIRA